jgi:hypothetical protein
MPEKRPEYQRLLVTPDFERSLSAATADGSLEFSDEEFDGIMEALDVLDAAPADAPGQIRLHAMQVELRPWWSITPPRPPGTGIRVMVRSEQRDGAGVWIVGAVTRHYRF